MTMSELVFYDQRHPLKRRWNTMCDESEPRSLPRLPSLSEWANLKPLVACAVTLPPPVIVPVKEESPAKPTPMRNTSRERMKAEQASLRAQAALLETELSTLRRMQQERLAGCKSTSDSYHGWQQAAQEKWEGRVEAERENKRLRATVVGLAAEVKSLESLFKSRSSALTASLKQHSLLALQLQALVAADDREALKSEASPKATKSKQSKQQSPRDVSITI